MIPTFNEPLAASAFEGDVVVTGDGGFCGSFTPEAMLASLDGLRTAADEAIQQRDLLARP